MNFINISEYVYFDLTLSGFRLRRNLADRMVGTYYVQAVGVSAMTGEGMDELFEAVQEAREEYLTDYKPQLDAVVAERVRLISFLRTLSIYLNAEYEKVLLSYRRRRRI